MQKIVIHVGYQRTATSWLQRKALPVWGKTRFLNLWTKPYYYLVHDMIGQHAFRPSLHTATIQKLYDLANTPGDKPLILSFECFVGLGSYGSMNAREIAQRIRLLFNDFDVSILICIRNQRTAIESFYRHFVNIGSTMTAEEALTRQDLLAPAIDPYFFCYHHSIMDYANAFGAGNVHVLLFENIVEGRPENLSELATITGIPAAAIHDIPGMPINASVSYGRVKLLRFVNRFSASPHTYRSMIPETLLPRGTVRRFLQRHPGSGMQSRRTFTEEVLAKHPEFVDAYKESNEILLQQYPNLPLRERGYPLNE
jgi:hypothetical protein